MQQINISTDITVFNTHNELSGPDHQLVDAAIEACANAYAPYSAFHVGAAVLLANGEIITGTNQENAAYPSGLCAERVAIFYANSKYPKVAVKAIAIAAKNEDGLIPNPVAPCGACRQVMLETELRFKSNFYTLLIGKEQVYKIEKVKDLLPLCFTGEELKSKK
ncbi:MAG: cytidine deaminase [Marinilabiliaceae bacterium]|nr:cytidine deaminase [Marinilabiliaceae bacterium]